MTSHQTSGDPSIERRYRSYVGTNTIVQWSFAHPSDPIPAVDFNLHSSKIAEREMRMKNAQQNLAALIRFIDVKTAVKCGAVALCASLIGACSTPAPPASPALQAKAPEPAPQPQPSSTPEVSAAAVPAEPAMDGFERLRGGVGNESVFFDFDKFAIRSDQLPAITDNAKLAGTYSNDLLTLQGNCDERGSREYNVALGQRRADAVKERLVLLGVPETRIETVSFGKEKPRALCHNESCWSENRRTDFDHQWSAPR
jgi:peptidoglycan-associated lipoprotein